MLVTTMLLIGAVLVGVALIETPVRRLPMSSALVYLVAGWGAALLLPEQLHLDVVRHAPVLLLVSEWAVLVSLFSIGLKLGKPSASTGWRIAVEMASSGMLATVALATVAAWALLGLDWPAALLLAAILAPTDPVLASDVQVRSETDRDAVHLALTAEGALNDGSAFPLVMLGLAMLGLHELGPLGRDWVVKDLLWAVGGGIVVGWGIGRAIGWAVRRRRRSSQPMSWDELLYLGTIALSYGIATGLHLSTFLTVFFAGVALFNGGRRPAPDMRLQAAKAAAQDGASPAGGPAKPGGDEDPMTDATDLPHRLMAFGERCERLVEVLLVLAIGAALSSVRPTLPMLLFALLLLAVVRPLGGWLGVWPKRLPRTQRRLIAWFGVRGVGSLFYLAYALVHGVTGTLADAMVDICLLCIALSILLHGVSATPLMARYHRRRAPPPAVDGGA